ncbi:nuclear transport factor 2 family protein [Mycobacterium sp. 4858]|uniref:nuclear transport factor 2 family protein n=1 Tax=Mycobacterium sp. 4858 TaxID=2057185 RepID=UPI001159B520|nr:nuclear transport factor 2 family protein [Mycobacterium sp. 4858]
MLTSDIPPYLKSFLEAMHARDATGAARHLAENVTLKSPIVVEPFVGRDQAAGILTYLLDIIDEFTVVDFLSSNEHFAAVFNIRAGSTNIEGMDYIHLDDAGKVDSMTISWRPLPAVVAVQNRLAPAIGVPPLALVPVLDSPTRT